MELEQITRVPTAPQHATPLLFVHGAWHGAWCWDEYFLDWFAARGYACTALSLRAHGGSPGRERLRWTKIADYVEDVARVAAALPTPPVLIGHSMGGLVVQKYLESHAAPGAVLMASVPVRGAIGAALRLLFRHPRQFLKANLTLSLYPVVETPALARHYLFSPSMPQDQVDRYFPRLQDESYRAFLDMIVFSLPRAKRVKTPVLVLGAEQDNVFSPSEVYETAHAYQTRAVLYPGMAHDMMLEPGWEQVAGEIARWLKEDLKR